ncbi:MAG TPA: hypothetical protein DEP84_25705 [Chloroflexi bacterium]|nr:hypothetical protein [Chloroflexota bacterium]
MAKGGTFIVAHADNPQNLNPFHPDIPVDELNQRQLFEGLLVLDQDFNLEPTLAESYEVSDDNKVYTFKLRPGVKFHNGDEFGAEDVVYTWQWAMKPENASASLSRFDQVEKVEAPDAETVRVTLKSPSGPFLRRTATHGIVPHKYHASMSPEEFNQAPVGTGPFKFKEWVPGDHVSYVAFDGYWAGRPAIDEFRQVVIPEDSVRAVALRTGEIHSSAWPLAPDDTLDLLEDPNFTVYRAPGLELSHIQINQKRKPFQDPAVRKALMYGMDREAMRRDIMRELATLAQTNLSPALSDFYDPNVTQYAQDLDKAAALLDEAGWVPGSDGIRAKDGDRLDFVLLMIQGDEIRPPQAELAIESWKKIGVQARIERAEVGTFVDKIFGAADFDLAFYNWTYGGKDGDPDAFPQLACDGSDNHTAWCDQKATELLKRGLETVDDTERRAIYSDFQKLFAEEVPFLYIMFWDDIIFISKKVQGLPGSARRPRGILNEIQHATLTA